MRASEHDILRAGLGATPHRSLLASFCGEYKRTVLCVRFHKKTHVTPCGAMNNHLTLGGFGRAP